MPMMTKTVGGEVRGFPSPRRKSKDRPAGDKSLESECDSMSRPMPDFQSEEQNAAAPGTESQKSGVTLRALVIGLLMVCLIVGMTQVLSIQRSAAEIGGGAPAPAPTYLLFGYVLLLAPVLSRFHR